MTGRRHDRSTFLPALTRPVRAGIRHAGVLVACASLAAGCGLIPGVSGGDGDGPITVMTWAPQDTNLTNKPGMPAFARAYARWVNSHGGIDGRKLHVATCNERNDSVSAAKCARRAVKENAVAVVGSYSQYANSFFPILESAGIPFIGGYGITDDEFTSPLSYPVNGGQPALLAGLGQELADDCGPVSLVRPDTIAGDELPVMLNAGLKARGHTQADDVRAAEDATEFSTQTRSALSGATRDPEHTGCVVSALGDRTGTFMDSFRRAREEYPDVRTGTVLGSVDQTVIDASGGRSGPYEGSFITGWYPVETDPRWDGMKKVIREQAFTDTRIDPADAGVQTTWIAYTVLKAALDRIGGGEVSPDTVRRTLDDGMEIDTGGLTPTLRWKFQDRLASIGFPRLVNTDVTLQVVREGRLVSARKGFLDMTKALQGADV
ncbi:ABC-type branched-subunit amino acid transport system substrate-binding protein [Streptomyces sp. SAI-170]|uniref:ABC transporter substrate-binding protein n=1 Tax=Streptomyces sp. SAI-170 TaxID=3377729 RepID=UPI003C7E7550